MQQFTIGKNIRKWRSFKGKKQESLAKEVGISRIMLSRYENGRSKTSLEILEAIAKSLGVDIQKLIDPNNET